MGLHRTPRSSRNAAAQPVARAALDSLLDDCGIPRRRWLAVVRPGRDALTLRRPAAFCSRGFGDRGSAYRSPSLQGHQKNQPAPASLPTRAALLVKSFAAGSIFISLRAYHDGV